MFMMAGAKTIERSRHMQIKSHHELVVKRLFFKLSTWCTIATHHPIVDGIVFIMIIVGAVLVALEVSDYNHSTLDHIGIVVLSALALEILLRMLAYGASPIHYFYIGWNVFDVLVLIAGIAAEVMTAAVAQTRFTHMSIHMSVHMSVRR